MDFILQNNPNGRRLKVYARLVCTKEEIQNVKKMGYWNTVVTEVPFGLFGATSASRKSREITFANLVDGVTIDFLEAEFGYKISRNLGETLAQLSYQISS